MKLPDYIFTGDISKRNIQGFYDYINLEPFHSDDLVNTNFSQEIEAVRNTIIEHYEKLGFDASERIFSNKRIHFLTRDSFSKFAEELGYSSTDRAFFSSSYFRIFISELGDDEFPTVLKRICHELIHSSEYREIEIDEKKQKFILKRMGYQNRRDYDYLNESLIDITTLQIIKHYWDQNIILNTYAYDALFQMTYIKGLVLLDAIFEYIEDNSDYSYHQILSKMQIDSINGTGESFQIFNEVLGETRVDILKNLDWMESFEDLKNISIRLELNRFLNSFDFSNDGQDYLFCKRL